MTVGDLQPFKDLRVYQKAKTPSFQHDYGTLQTFKRKVGQKRQFFAGRGAMKIAIWEVSRSNMLQQ